MSSVGQALGGIVGGIVGWFVGGGPAGAIYGAQLGMGIGGMIDPPKGPTIHGPRLSDLTVQTSTLGAPLPRIHGTVATHGNVFWLENNRLKEVVKKKKSGGKGGGGGSTIKTYTYFATFAVSLADCRHTGAIAGVRRIWVAHKLLYDAGSDDVESIIASNEAARGFSIYTGSATQEPDPRMQADLGVANCPALRGLAYIVFYDYALKDHGNSLMGAQVKVEVVSSATTGGVTLINDVTVPYVKQQTANPFLPHPYYLTLDSARFYSPNWDGSYPPESTFTVYHVGLYDGHTAGTEVVSVQPGDVPPNGTTDDSDGYFVGRRVVLNDGGAMAGPDGCLQQRGDYTAGVNGSFVYLASSGADSTISVASTAVGVAVTDGGTVYAIRTDGIDVYDTTLAHTNTTAYAFTGLVLAQCRAEVSDGHLWVMKSPQGGELWRISLDLSEIVLVGSIPGVVANSYYAAEFHVEGGVLVRALPDWDTSTLRFQHFQLQTFVAGPSVSLSSIVQSECLQSGLLTAGDLDVSELTQAVRGYRVAQTGAIRGALEPLQAAWPFDPVPSGYQIAFRKRGRASSATIPATDLDARADGDAPGTQLVIAREMDTQLPRRVTLKHLDVNREYDQGEQLAERLRTDSVHVRDLELPIVLTAAEAAGMAEVLLYLYWLERRDVSFRLPPSYRALELADVVTITGEWGTYELRLTSVHLLSDGRLECSARFNAAATYMPTATGAEATASAGTVALAGPTYYALLDVPLLRDQDDEPGFLLAMAGYTTGWPGGVLYRSADGGQTWGDLQAVASAVTLGFARTALGAGRTDIIDASNTLRVDMLAGDLSSVSELTMLGGENHFALGADGRWEIIAARDCALQGDGSYLLSNFLRGVRGTEWAMTTHQAGDVLVYLPDLDIAFIGMESASIGLEREYRGITVGRALDTDTDAAFTYRGVNLKPLSPIRLNGHRRPSTSDWTLSWTRRGRLSPQWADLVDVPLGEASESYEVDIYDGAGYATVKRTLTTTSATAAYTSAQQVADFGSNQSTLYVKVYQMSATIGRGYALTASITR